MTKELKLDLLAQLHAEEEQVLQAMENHPLQDHLAQARRLELQGRRVRDLNHQVLSLLDEEMYEEIAEISDSIDEESNF